LNKIVGISDMKMSDSEGDTIITHSLGSCVGVTLYDPEAGIGGMIHCMLPLSRVSPDKAKAKPYMFVDRAVPAFLQEMYDRGARKDNLVVKVAGGAAVLDRKDLFKIGKRNYTVLRKILWKNNILIDAEDVGGSKSRTMALYMDTGKTTIKSKGVEVEL